MIRSLSVLMAIAGLFWSAAGRAATLTWTGGDGTWDSTDVGWTPAATDPWNSTNGAGNVARFTTTNTVTVSNLVSTNGIDFSGATTVTGGTIDFAGASPTVTFSAASPYARISSTLTGGAGLTLSSDSPGNLGTGRIFAIEGNETNTFGDLTVRNTNAITSTGFYYIFTQLNKAAGAAFDGNLVIDGGASFRNFNVVYLVSGNSFPTGGDITLSSSGTAPTRFVLAGYDQPGNSIEVGGLTSTGNSQGNTSVSAGYGTTNRAGTTTTLTINNATDYVFGGQLLDNVLATVTPLAIVKNGIGTQTLAATNTYTGSTAVNQGTLAVNGSIATSSGVSVASGATLAGSGVVAAVSGAGRIAPGNSAGILTAPSIDPASGMGFAFEFGATGSPDYTDAAASINDVLHLTGATPLGSALTGSNAIDVYFNVTTLGSGDTFRGGAYIDADVDFLAQVQDATYNYFVLGDGNGPTDGYYTLSQFDPSLSISRSTVNDPAAFSGGSQSGRVMEFQAVPEPATLALLAGGVLAAGALARRRAGNRARLMSSVS
jgi:fibronectin-binding autotransporter adhesin